jgi:hypothetical protein
MFQKVKAAALPFMTLTSLLGIAFLVRLSLALQYVR